MSKKATFEDLRLEADALQDFLETEILDELNSLSERGNMLSVYLARSSKMLADSKYILDSAKYDACINIINKIIGEDLRLAKSIQTGLVDGILKEENYLVEHLTQLNKAIKYQIEWCRTQISKEKELLRNNI